MPSPPFPSPLRLKVIADRPPSPGGDYVLYWMIGARRPTWNFALDRAADWARQLGRPLLVFEAIDCTYQWASARFHRFVIDGMRDNRDAFAAAGVGYYPYVEPAQGAGHGLLAALAARAAVVVTDWSPAFRLPQLVAASIDQVPVRFEQVDGIGILPLDGAPAGHVYPTAFAFRRHLQGVLREHLRVRPKADGVAQDGPGRAVVPADVLARWPQADDALLDGTTVPAALPVDHGVGPSGIPGGARAASARLQAFLDESLPRYGEERNHPDDDVASGLSPYLHFGHVSSHEVVTRVLRREQWSLSRLGAKVTGSKAGWWGASAGAEGFLDQIVTWRELGFNMAARRPDYDQYDSLPPWALNTLAAHAADPREFRYSLDEFAAAATHDPLWNAAQRQLVREGRMHNYLRMLWGKKILEWTATPQDALAAMIELNNRYALDGRDPNSYTGIFWVLGRYDRPWFERPIYGTVRYMTSESTARKLRVKAYLAKYGEA